MSDEIANFPINLLEVFFNRVHVESLTEYQDHLTKQLVLAPPKNEIELSINPNDKYDLAITMRTIMNESRNPEQPYFIDMICTARFMVSEPYKSDDKYPEAIRAAQITGHSVAYGAIRESIQWITSRQPYGGISLGLSILNSKKSDNASEKK